MRRYQVVQASPGAADMERLRTLLAGAKRPLVILGGTVWTREACADLQRFAEANELPVGCAFRFQDLFDNRSAATWATSASASTRCSRSACKDADLLLVVGARLGEMTTSGYTLVAAPRPTQKLIHVHAGAEELGRVYQGDLLINSGVPQLRGGCEALPPIDGSARLAPLVEARAPTISNGQKPRAIPGKVQIVGIVDWLRQRAARGRDHHQRRRAISPAGCIASYRYTGLRTQLAPTTGAMGYGVPAGVAAKIAHPERIVISVRGDGDFLMNGQELATAVQYDAPWCSWSSTTACTAPSACTRRASTRRASTAPTLSNPHFAALARAFGAHGEIVEETAQFAPAFERIVAVGKPALIELRIDPQAITTKTTLDALRAAAMKR